MSVVVRPAGAEDIESICDLLHGHMSSRIARESWRRLLDYPWRPADAGRGMVALDGDRAVGFLGLVYADRSIGGAVHRFCNICAWYLLKDYRGRGIGQEIQKQSIADPGMTYTLVTATASTDRSFRAAGFAIADDTRYCLKCQRDGAFGIEILEDPAAVDSHISPQERAIRLHHAAANLRHIVFREGSRSCYLILQNRKKGDDISYHQVLYAGNPDFLARHGQAMANLLLDSDDAVFAIDRRFVPGAPDWPREPIAQPRLYRSRDLQAHQIDNLYSEIALLDLKLP